MRPHVCSLIVAALSLPGCDDATSSAPADAGDDAGQQRFEYVVCADRSAEPRCSSPCAANEVCFTQVACGPAAQTCTSGEGHGDDRCHRTCDGDADCRPGESCTSESFFGCGDFNGARTICVEAP